ncbi:hypothetical protein I317_03061 [Kwoniella heveanensis CBS 569]|nr:hypothetical protein I317_03061 [Kwoniella heveanensis CBS 569]
MSAQVYGQSDSNATCYPPELNKNATTDVCCFVSEACAEAVCASQNDLLNATVNRAFGTNFCYLAASPANYSYYTFENQTCLGTGMTCRTRSDFVNAGQITLGSSSLLLAWIAGLWVLALFSRK